MQRLSFSSSDSCFFWQAAHLATGTLGTCGRCRRKNPVGHGRAPGQDKAGSAGPWYVTLVHQPFVQALLLLSPSCSASPPAHLLDLQLHDPLLGQLWGQHLEAEQQVRGADRVKTVGRQEHAVKAILDHLPGKQWNGAM